MLLHNYQEITINGYKLEWLFILSFICITLGICTIVAKNPVSSILFLIVLFVFISLYLIILNIPFIAISYLLVYVGAVSILFLFILMLINVRISELLTEGKNSSVLAVLVVLAFAFAFFDKLPSFINISNFYITSKDLTISNVDILNNLNIDNNLSTVYSNNWDSSLIEVTHITSIGNTLYSVYLIHMTVLGNILLLAMVGAIVITVKLKDKTNHFKLLSVNYTNVADNNI